MIKLLSKVLPPSLTLVVGLLFLATQAMATTAIMLIDDDLIQSSRVILIGDILSLKAQSDANQDINTYAEVQVLETLKGRLHTRKIVFKQLGGTIGETSSVVFGAPQLRVGQRVLLFLDTDSNGTLRIAHLFQGKYDVVEDQESGKIRVERKIDANSVRLINSPASPEVTNSEELDTFRSKIQQVLRSNRANVRSYEEKYKFVPIIEIPHEYKGTTGGNAREITPGFAFLPESARWYQPDDGGVVLYWINPAGSPVPGDSVPEIMQALAAWTDVPSSSIRLYFNSYSNGLGLYNDGYNQISYNDPRDQLSDPVGCGGVIAATRLTRVNTGVSRYYCNNSFRRIDEADFVFNRYFECFLSDRNNFMEVAAHETGHTIGLAHSDVPDAIMQPYAYGNRGPRLGSDDVDAVTCLYPQYVGDNAAFVSQSVPTTMTAGQSYNVSVTMRNTGASTWFTAADGSGFKLGTQNPQDNTLWTGGTRIYLPPGVSVPSGAEYTFNFTVTAPSVCGNYNFQWRMVHEGVQWFGEYTPNVVISLTGCGSSCDPVAEQSCYDRGGEWDPSTCRCIVTNPCLGAEPGLRPVPCYRPRKP